MGFLPIIILSCAIALQFDKKIEETIAVAIMLTSAVLYVVGLFLPLKYGLWVIYLISIISAVYIVYAFIRKKSNVNNILTIGSVAFLFFIAIFFFLSRGRDFCTPDDWYFWGLEAKSFHYYGDMFSPLSTAIPSGHPPVSTLIEYFFTSTWITFSDSMCFFALNIFVIALLVPVFSFLSNKVNVMQTLVLMFIIFAAPCLVSSDVYNIIMCDGLVGALLFYSFFAFTKYHLNDDKFYLFSTSLSLVIIVLTKRLGMAVAVFLLAVFIFVLVKVRLKDCIRECLILILPMTVAIMSWFGLKAYALLPLLFAVGGAVSALAYSWYINNDATTKRNINVVMLCVIMCVFIGALVVVEYGGLWPQQCMKYYLIDLFSVYDVGNGLKALPYGYYIVLSLVMVFITGTKTEQKDDNYYHILFSLYSMCMIGYSLLMLVLHVLDVGPSNNYYPHIITRYTYPWMMALVLLIVVYVLHYIAEEKKKSVYLILILACLVLAMDSDSFFKNAFDKYQQTGYYAFENAGVGLTTDDCIYFVDEVDDFDWRDREFYYAMFPAKTNFAYSSVLDSQGVGPITFSADEWSEILAERYTYVYLQTIDDEFVMKYGELFDDVDDISAGNAYRVDKSNGVVRLLKIAN